METPSFFARTKAVPHPERFAMVAVRPAERDMAFRVAGAEAGFVVVMDTGTEITLLLPQERWSHVAPVFLDPAAATDFRVVTLDAGVELHAVGYISALSSALARAGIPVCVFSAFTCDHLLVRDGDLNRALEVLAKAGVAAAGRA